MSLYTELRELLDRYETEPLGAGIVTKQYDDGSVEVSGATDFALSLDGVLRARVPSRYMIYGYGVTNPQATLNRHYSCNKALFTLALGGEQSTNWMQASTFNQDGEPQSEITDCGAFAMPNHNKDGLMIFPGVGPAQIEGILRARAALFASEIGGQTYEDFVMRLRG